MDLGMLKDLLKQINKEKENVVCKSVLSSFIKFDSFNEGCTNPGCQVARTTKFCSVAPKIFESSVWNLLHVTVRAPKIMSWLQDFFWKICAPLNLIVCRGCGVLGGVGGSC